MTKQMTDEEWKHKLTPEQYQILRGKGTETPGTGKFLDHNENGDYTCAACGNVIFTSKNKYESTTPGLVGWPSFSEAASNDAVELTPDNDLSMQRTEVTCKNCGGHLGHLFDADDSPNGKHYCINSGALDFNKSSLRRKL
ncbi:MAG: peptide-methionine (R)-S-oxide reductase MsrB [Candidatus Saccharimonadales bacterium]